MFFFFLLPVLSLGGEKRKCSPRPSIRVTDFLPPDDYVKGNFYLRWRADRAHVKEVAGQCYKGGTAWAESVLSMLAECSDALWGDGCAAAH